MAATTLAHVLAGCAGTERASRLLDAVEVHPSLLTPHSDVVSRAVVAQALNLLLLDRLLDAVPTGAAYVEEKLARGERMRFDHGAVRTVAGVDTGALPEGQESLTRVLRALGYAHRETYDLAALRMTGRSWCHQDLPADIPQFFVSELHADRFSEAFQATAARVLGGSTDPLGVVEQEALAHLERHGALPLHTVEEVLPAFLACFTRRHPEPTEADYEALLGESQEMAWIATEGNAFNHATDRVDDVRAVAAAEQEAGRPIKDAVEVSGSGRVLQTAHRAALVTRTFRTADGGTVERVVPGSFYEFITRLPLPDGSGIDLAFDASNAQEIFTMTRRHAAR